VTSITFDKTMVSPNSTFNLTVTVKNNGTSASAASNLALYLNSATPVLCGATAQSTLSIGSIAAGSSASFVFSNVNVGTVTGSKAARVFVDSGCSYNESNEINNQLTASYTVNYAPDFVLTGIAMTSRPKANGTLSASVTIKNQGSAGTASQLNLGVWTNQATSVACSTLSSASLTVTAPPVGASTTYTFSGLPAGSAGSKTFRAFIDRGCAVPELLENNNQSAATYTVY
jgi:subtilase family serine protease